MAGFVVQLGLSSFSAVLSGLAAYLIHLREAATSRMEDAQAATNRKAEHANERCSRIEGFLSAYGFKPSGE